MPRSWPLVCLGDRDMLAQRAHSLGLRIELHDYVPGAEVEHAGGSLSLLHQPLATASVPGRLDPANAAAVLALIDRAVEGCVAGEFCAMVTAPVQKSLIIEAGFAFTGHTEYIAARTGAALPVMMLVAANLRVALATTHLPLRAVSDALSIDGLLRTLQILSQALRRYWRVPQPRIGVCGLNPHAGEGGHLGDEELRIIGPAIGQAQAAGLSVDGPWPADTLFVPSHLAPYDAVLAMYHDQGLPVLKHAGFGHALAKALHVGRQGGFGRAV